MCTIFAVEVTKLVFVVSINFARSPILLFLHKPLSCHAQFVSNRRRFDLNFLESCRDSVVKLRCLVMEKLQNLKLNRLQIPFKNNRCFRTRFSEIELDRRELPSYFLVFSRV